MFVRICQRSICDDSVLEHAPGKTTKYQTRLKTRYTNRVFLFFVRPGIVPEIGSPVPGLPWTKGTRWITKKTPGIRFPPSKALTALGLIDERPVEADGPLGAVVTPRKAKAHACLGFVAVHATSTRPCSQRHPSQRGHLCCWQESVAPNVPRLCYNPCDIG
jgi:hypothetical protein